MIRGAHCQETSLSEGDVRNVIVTLRNIVIVIVTLGGSLDLFERW